MLVKENLATMEETTAELLLKLQTVDYQLGELERSKEYLPDMIKNLTGEMEQATQRIADARKGLESAQLEKKKLELEIEEHKATLTRLKSQMMAIKTNKEYDAITHEINLKESRIADAEDRLLEIMEAIETVTGDLEELESTANDVSEKNGERLKAISGEMEAVGAKIEMKDADRKNILVRLDRQIVATYERIRRGRGSDAVVAVKNGICAGCFKSLPPQLVQDIRRGDRVITCDSCGRLLIWND